MIKFRVWGKKNKKFYDDFAITGEGELLESLSVWGEYTSADIDDYVIQQSTGLLDKNGKEIYEGDIVEVKLHHDEDEMPQKFVGIAEVRRGSLVLIDKTKAPQHTLTDIGDYPMGDLHIIGNIFENPELLEK